jgi:hypothetical protein
MSGHRVVRLLLAAVFAGAWGMAGRPAAAQEELIERTGPPALDDLETDANKDGVPDGWYNARDAAWMAEGGKVGPHFVRCECDRPGRPSRLSRAFGIDGRKTEAIILGLWVKQEQIQTGERRGEEPSLLIDFLGGELRTLSRGVMGPWTHSVGNRWTRVAKRIAVPPGTRDAIMSVGLLGATGQLDFDGLTVDLVPVGGAASTNLVVNGDFELGDPAPAYWVLEKEARRVFPGLESTAALELTRAESRALAGLAIPVERLGALEVAIAARCAGLRGGGGATARVFFLDSFGDRVAGPENGRAIFVWAGSSAWRVDRARVNVPPDAVRAVLQIDKLDSVGSIRIDDVRVTTSPDPAAGSWTPFHVVDADPDAEADWLPVAPSPTIAAGSALDVSFLLPAPAGRDGFVAVKEGRLAFSRGGRARFLGVSLIPPAAFLEPERADALASRLARCGINLVRLGELDTPLGPDRSLIDDTRDDTLALDAQALAHLDHLVAALKARGIAVALELQGGRRFRVGDGVALPGLLPPGGGPAAQFDPTIGKLALTTAQALLGHVNPETGLALAEDPALAWVTLAGEVSLFDLIERPDALPAPYARALHTLAEKARGGVAGRRLWESLEADHSRRMAEALRQAKVRVPIAGVSHWRREPEFVAAQAGAGLDLIDDRLYWATPAWVSPEVRSMLWSLDGGLAGVAGHKRRADRPYVVGQWCNQSLGAWSAATEAADLLLGVHTAAAEDWDALIRRGVFYYPLTWGDGPTGTVGGEDIFQVPEVVNGSPHLDVLWPHASSLFYRGGSSRPEREPRKGEAPGRGNGRSGRRAIPGWDGRHGRLVVDTPHTQALAGWVGGQPARFDHLELASENVFLVLAATSIGPEPIATSQRLLVSAVGRVEPTGFRWVDDWRHAVADPGRPPFLQEPVRARVVWRRKGPVRAFALNNAGERVGPAPLEVLPGGRGVALVLDGRTAGFHWELVAE